MIKTKEIEEFSNSAEYAKIEASAELTKQKMRAAFDQTKKIKASLADKASEEMQKILTSHRARLDYQAAYQRDMRKAKKLGISVKEYRSQKSNP